MRIEIDVPDFCGDMDIRKMNLRIMAGIHMIARKPVDRNKWLVKISHCSQCGTCCLNLPKNHPLVTPDGSCKFIKRGKINTCGLGIDRPYPCSVGTQQKGNPEGCSIEYKEA